MVHVQWGLVATAGLLLAGCGGGDDGRPERVPVSGTVMYNGKPLENAGVTFVPKGEGKRSATGATDAQGRYRLTTFDTNDGAIIGNHDVAFYAVKDDNRNPDGTPRYSEEDPRWKPPKSIIPDKYGDPRKSGLTKEVTKGKPNVFDFELKD